MRQQSEERINAMSFSEAIKDELPLELKDECECMICSNNYNLHSRVPMNICQSQHHCCLQCLNKILNLTKDCPFCKKTIVNTLVSKNRIICKVLQEAAKRKGVTYKVNQNPEIRVQHHQQQIRPPNQFQHSQPLLPSVPSDAIRVRRIRNEYHRQHVRIRHTPQIQKLAQRINNRLFHNETVLILWNTILIFIVSIVEINYSNYNEIQTNSECCLFFENCKSINSRIKQSCSTDSVSSFCMIAPILLFYVCKRNWKKYTQTFLCLFVLTYLIMSIKIVCYSVIQKLDSLELQNDFSKHNGSSASCMDTYYIYFGYIIYLFGFWTGICLLYMVCRWIANK